MKRRELDELVAAGVITEEQGAAIEGYFRSREGGRRTRWMMLCLSWLAAAFVVGGVVMLVSANWQTIPPLVKMSCGMGLMLAAWVAWGCCVKSSPILAEFFGLVGGGMWLANIALYGQIFQLQNPFVEGVTLFLVGIVLLPFVVRQRLLLGAVAVTSLVWLVALFNADSQESVLSLRRWDDFAMSSCMLLLVAWWLFGEKCRCHRGDFRTYSWIAVPALLGFLLTQWLLRLSCHAQPQDEMGWWIQCLLWGAVPVLMLLTRPEVPWKSWLMLTVMLSILQPMTTFLSSMDVSWVRSLVASILFFVCALVLMMTGMRGGRPFWINAGALLMVFCGLGMADGLLGSYTDSGLLMVGCGLFLLLFVVVLEKSRRRMMQTMLKFKETETSDKP